MPYPRNHIVNALSELPRRTEQRQLISPISTALGGTNALAENIPVRQAGPMDTSWYRQDGSRKGRGYLGPVRNPYGQTMTEYSIGVEMDGREVEIPTFVPTLTPQELNYLTRMGDGQQIPESIVRKAVDHARMRMQQGLSPWHDSGPNHTKSSR